MNNQSFRRKFDTLWWVYCAFTIAVCTPSSGAAASGAPSPDPARFASEIEAFESYDRKNSWPADAILFVGSSSIRLWQTAESFPKLPVINRGFGGSHTRDVNHFADRIVLKYRPRVIVFYCGDNDIFSGIPPEQVFADFQEFVSMVRSTMPATRIIYLSIKPSPSRWKLWPQMQKANKFVSELAQREHHLTYVDIATPMLGDDGKPRGELFLDDGLHLNATGYRLWSNILASHLNPL
jgi:lysophospholipase L1-like esterase